MAVFPADDLSLSLTIRNRLKPLIASHSSSFTENVKRNSPTSGASQSRDIWGRKRFQASIEFDRKIDDAELLMSFWEMYGSAGFTFFDFEQIVIGTPGYRNPDPLGTGDGSTVTFTIRAKEIAASSLTVYNNTVAVSSGFYSLSAGTGAQGEDRLVFVGGYIPQTAKNVTGATNANPVVITATSHGRSTGDKVTIAGVLGNTAANVTLASIVVINANSFSLTGIAGNGSYTSGGVVAAASLTIAYKGRRRYTVEIPSPPSKSNSDWNLQKVQMTILERF